MVNVSRVTYGNIPPELEDLEMPTQVRSTHPEMTDAATCPNCIPGNLEVQKNHLSTQGEKNYNPPRREKVGLKHLHDSRGEG